MGLRLAVENCPLASFLIKSDDDVQININYLLNSISHARYQRTVLGLCLPHMSVIRPTWDHFINHHRHYKNWVSCKDYPYSHYPDYVSGQMYLITADIIQELYELSRFVPHVRNEDVYTTGILRSMINASLQCDKRLYWKLKTKSSSPIISHIMFPVSVLLFCVVVALIPKTRKFHSRYKPCHPCIKFMSYLCHI